MLTRSDPGGTSKGLSARYVGSITAAELRGTVEWNYRGKVSRGTFRAVLAPAEQYGPVLTWKQASDIFRLMKDQKDIAFGYRNDGCFARAHCMVRRMQSLGVTPGKAWAFANPDALVVRTPRGVVEWRYHVAPTVRVRLATGDYDLVIDPSLFDRPVSPAAWLGAMRQKGKGAPHLSLTAWGEAPVLASGDRAPGTGYWPGDDPPDVDAAARAEMAKDKVKER